MDTDQQGIGKINLCVRKHLKGSPTDPNTKSSSIIPCQPQRNSYMEQLKDLMSAVYNNTAFDVIKVRRDLVDKTKKIQERPENKYFVNRV